ncbi:MAG: hypothetical protein KAT91_00525 [Candidatus Aenigmarchaeota archaeon]|nr:hypothetical protein [Candidatus Aenigmarchaeota archaeon]
MNKLLLILAILLVAGCTSNNDTGSQSNQGIIIESLVLSPSDVVDQEPFDLFFKVANVGGKTKIVTAYIYGPEWVEETDLDKHELIAPNKQTGSIGESFVFEKTFGPIDVSKGLTEEYTVNGRICYPYETVASTDVEIISLAEKRITDVKQATRTVKTQNSDAPIHIEFTIKEPLVVYDETTEKIPIAVKVRDVGGGFATKEESCSKNPDILSMDRISVNLEGAGITCDEKEVHITNKQATLFCTMDAATGGLPSKTVKIIATASYRYYKTKQATVRISGT